MTVQKNKQSRSLADEDLQKIAQAFVTARLSGTALEQYPGAIPGDLSTAYEVQDRAIDLWPEELCGWKVGRIPPHLESQSGIDRLAGPIFASTVHRVTGDNRPTMPVFVGGFGAVEAEFVAVIAKDAPHDKLTWSTQEADAMIADVCIGLEVASSPLAAINDLGPPVTASDFGNNAGLIVGARIGDWRARDPQTLTCEAFIDGESVGSGGAYLLTGGIVRSVQFMLELAAARGRPLRAGDLIATGQTSGIHEIAPGQTARIAFADDGELTCEIVAATA